MNKFETFAEFLSTQSPNVPLLNFIFNLILAAFIGYVLGRVYVKYGESLSNRKLFAKNFILLTTTTMIIITIVKSSLALSLGLVGALSIVRFRAAIKEPEELSYLFLAISAGLGLGADQVMITVTGVVIVLALVILRRFRQGKDEHTNLIVTVSSDNPSGVSLDHVIDILSKYSSNLSMKRIDESSKLMEANFLAEFDKFENFNTSRKELQKLDESLRISYLDNKGLFA